MNNDEKLRRIEKSTREVIERQSIELINLILTQSPEDLLGYFAFQFLQEVPDENSTFIRENRTTIVLHFLLEYIHAALATNYDNDSNKSEENIFMEIFERAEELYETTMSYCSISSNLTKNSHFGSRSSEIEYLAKSHWVMIRGNRYQVLEKEFYSYVLLPHDDILQATYGVGSIEIAKSFQMISDSIREGHMKAVTKFSNIIDNSNSDLFPECIPSWLSENPDKAQELNSAADDIFRGGIFNISKHTNLPPSLLADLAYNRGEETEFLYEGELRGTPLRTMPVRKKPLICLHNSYFALDPSFIRDSGYRALLWNLLNRDPSYKTTFEARQKDMSERAFDDIVLGTLEQARVYREIWYKDSLTGEWVENDTLVIIEDVLIQIEAKAGAAATVASPAIDFNRHLRSIQDFTPVQNIFWG